METELFIFENNFSVVINAFKFSNKISQLIFTCNCNLTAILTLLKIVSKSELTLATAKLDGVRAEEALAELYVSYTKITAPYDGVIDRLKLKSGSLIDEGTLLTTLSNNNEVFAYFNVSELEYLDYKNNSANKNNSVKLILANNQEHKFPGKIETIEGEFDKNTGSIAFRAKFPNPD